MRIKIISGTYGYRDDQNHLVPKNRSSAPFDVPKEEAERLAELGVAEIVTEEVATPTADIKADVPKDNPPETKTATEDENELDEEELKKLTFAELKKTASDMGIDTAALKSKAAVVTAIMQTAAEAPPALNAEEPVI